MAEPHTLNPGDRVRHPEWPEGETRVIERLYPFQHLSRNTKGRVKLVDSPTERVAVLDAPAAARGEEPDSGWMEAGLELVEKAHG